MTIPSLIDAIVIRWLRRRGYQVVSKSMWSLIYRARANERRAWIDTAIKAQRERDAALNKLRELQS